MNRRELMLVLSGAMTAPRTLRAQQKAIPVIGFLNGGSAEANPSLLAAFHEGLREAGRVEGENLKIEYRWAEFRYDRLPELAADLVGRKVDVITACGSAGEALVAKNATSTIPIVFATGLDPVESGLIASLARPGGNLTGVTNLNVQLWQKRIELIAQLVPQARVIGLLQNPNNAQVEGATDSARQAAATKGLQLELLRAGTEAEIDAAFASCRRAACRSSRRRRSAIRQSTRADRSVGGKLRDSLCLYPPRLRRGRRTDQLWSDLYCGLSPGRHLCWKDSEWGQTRRSTGPPVDQFRAGRQSQHREGARPNGSALDPRPRRRGHRMTRREMILLLAGAMTAARTLRAQQKAMPVIGVLGSSSPGLSAANLAAFHQGLSETGYVEGQNVAIEYRWAEGRYDRLPGLAADLVGDRVDVIATAGTPSVLAAKSATLAIPIVGAIVDPGLIASLARPGGNVTGLTLMTQDITAKQLELLKDAVPGSAKSPSCRNPICPV
jgi:ABC-type uncharacterized transport system substrate-binding protein